MCFAPQKMCFSNNKAPCVLLVHAGAFIAKKETLAVSLDTQGPT
jgi:hypothetical protein